MYHNSIFCSQRAIFFRRCKMTKDIRYFLVLVARLPLAPYIWILACFLFKKHASYYPITYGLKQYQKWNEEYYTEEHMKKHRVLLHPCTRPCDSSSFHCQPSSSGRNLGMICSCGVSGMTGKTTCNKKERVMNLYWLVSTFVFQY